MSVRCVVRQVERRRLTEEIVDQLVSSLASGKLKRGDKLPPERVLMKQLGVGRSSLREAIGTLSLTGVLTVRPGSGTYITISQEEFLSKPLSWGIPMGYSRVQELIEARHTLEQAIAGMAAERASEADVAKISDQLAQMKNNRGNLRKVMKADVSFHTEIAKASNNTVLLNFMLQIRKLLQSWMEKAFSVPGVYDSTIEEHGEILNAIEMHDVERARAAVSKHLSSVGDVLTSVVLPKAAVEPNPSGKPK